MTDFKPAETQITPPASRIEPGETQTSRGTRTVLIATRARWSEALGLRHENLKHAVLSGDQSAIDLAWWYLEQQLASEAIYADAEAS